MRALIEPRLRDRWPTARIIHELPLRDGSNRIDMAAVTATELIGVEIKSSKDVIDRLEAQIRGFLPITHRLWVCLAPNHNEKLEAVTELHPPKGKRTAYTSTRFPLMPAQQVIERVGDRFTETWTVDAGAGETWQTKGGYLSAHEKRIPWSAAMLDLLWNVELEELAGQHHIGGGARHDLMVERLHRFLTGDQIVKGVCAALRGREAFVAGTDAPIRLPTALLVPEPPAGPVQATLTI